MREKDKKSYRLPTEAEWEYACRAGTTTPFHFGETISTDQANYNGNFTYGNGKKGVYRKKTTPVGSFPANAWGLYDMHGNVWQWCQDWYGDYPQKDVVDPQGPEKGEYRVLRGGSWSNDPRYCRSAYRLWDCAWLPLRRHRFPPLFLPGLIYTLLFVLLPFAQKSRVAQRELKADSFARRPRPRRKIRNVKGLET